MATCSNCSASFSGSVFDSTCPACRRLDNAVGKIRGNFVERAIAQAKEEHAAEVQQATLEASAAAAEAAQETAAAVKAQTAIAMKQANAAAARQARYDRSARLLFEASSLVREIDRARRDGSIAPVILWAKLQRLAQQLPVLTPDNVEPSQRGELNGVFDAIREAEVALQREAAPHITLLEAMAAFDLAAAEEQSKVAACLKRTNEALAVLGMPPLAEATSDAILAVAGTIAREVESLRSESVAELVAEHMAAAWARWNVSQLAILTDRTDVKLHTIRSARAELRAAIHDPAPIDGLQRWADTSRADSRHDELALQGTVLGIAAMAALWFFGAANHFAWVMWLSSFVAIALLVPGNLFLRTQLVRSQRDQLVIPSVVAERRAMELQEHAVSAQRALAELDVATAEAHALLEAPPTVALHAAFASTPELVEAHALRRSG